jgi:hypothetical protein
VLDGVASLIIHDRLTRNRKCVYSAYGSSTFLWTLIKFLLGYLVHVSEHFNFQEKYASFQHVFCSLLECGCLNLVLSIICKHSFYFTMMLMTAICKRNKIITNTWMSLSNITSEMPSVNENFNLVSPPVFPSTILLKVDAYNFIACKVNQC